MTHFKKSLEERFKDEETIGVYVEDSDTGLSESEFSQRYPDKEFSGISLLPNGESFFICTNSAKFVIQTLQEGELYGFVTDDNPSVTHSEILSSEGHDFALLRNRYIVDLWISHFTGCEKQMVYDLWDVKDHVKIKEIYGDPTAWLKYEEGREWVNYESMKPTARPRMRVLPDIDAQNSPDI